MPRMKLTGTVFKVCETAEEAKQLAMEGNRLTGKQDYAACTNGELHFVLLVEGSKALPDLDPISKYCSYGRP